MKTNIFWKAVPVCFGILALVVATQAQNLTNPCPNRIISWHVDDGSHGTINPTDLAGVAPAINWVNTVSPSMRDAYISGLTDNTGNTTTLDLRTHAVNVSAIPWPTATDPGLDGNGTVNKRMLNVYLNNGYSGWNTTDTNVYVALTNIPYARYDVVVYFNSDASGRHASIDNGSGMINYCSTIGVGFRNGVTNAVLLPTTETNSAVFPIADFAFFPGMTASNAVFTETPKSGDSQWLGITAFQVIESSNVYVFYGPAPATQIIAVGQPASFKAMAGGQDPSYQWCHAGTNIAGATNATYSIAVTAPGQDGNYDVVVTNSYSSVTSLVATLTFYPPKTIEWRGNGATWDTASLFWTSSGGGATNYAETDNVRFGPAGVAQPTVTLSDTRTPSSIVVSNATYTFVSGSLAGAGSLHLMNNGKFILDTIDARTGPTVIDAGCIFQLDNNDTAGSMGPGPLTNNGALVFYSSGDEAYGYPIYGSGAVTNLGPSGRVTLGAAINAAYLVQAGAGELLLQGNNSISGGVIVSGGNVQVVYAGALGGAPVTVAGGELQLFWGIDLSGSSLTLAGGRFSGIATWEGPATVTADSEIRADGNLILNNAAGLNGGAYNLSLTGSGALILAGTNNSWGSANISAGTLQVGNGGTADGSVSGAIQDGGVLTFNSAGRVTVSSTISGGGTLNQNGTGMVTFTGDNSGFTGSTTVSAGGFGGTSTFGGPVTVQSGATLAPGTTTAIGTLTINSDLSLQGNVLVKVNKSLAQSNDLVSVTGTLNNSGSGVVAVFTLGPSVRVGDTFKLFHKALTGGDTLSVVGAGMIWANNLAVDGTIQATNTLPRPVVTSVAVSGGTNIVISGSNGTQGNPYYVLSSTNLASANWVVESTGVFGTGGVFSVTNVVTPGTPAKFYRLEQ